MNRGHRKILSALADLALFALGLAAIAAILLEVWILAGGGGP